MIYGIGIQSCIQNLKSQSKALFILLIDNKKYLNQSELTLSYIGEITPDIKQPLSTHSILHHLHLHLPTITSQFTQTIHIIEIALKLSQFNLLQATNMQLPC